MQPEPPRDYIEHIPNEKRQTNTIWWLLWPLIGLLWLWYLYFFTFDWVPIALGLGTGSVLATWAIEITGNKAPDWMVNSLKSAARRNRKF